MVFSFQELRASQRVNAASKKKKKMGKVGRSSFESEAILLYLQSDQWEEKRKLFIVEGTYLNYFRISF